jgi:predicted dehydrogenase
MRDEGVPLRILVAGFGSIAQRHVRNLRTLTPLEVVAYRVGGEPLPEEFQGDWITETTDLEEALSRRPDAALVCSPPRHIMEVALRLARAGCPLFIEKPLSHTMEGVAELVSLVREQSLVSLMGYNLRYQPGLQLVKALLDEGRIGRVVSLRVQVGQYLPDWHPWEDYRKGYSARRDLGGGVITDLIHEIDYVRWLGGEVHRVVCFADHVSRLEIDTEDVAEILLGFESGAIGSVHVDYVQRAPTRGCQIIGDEGTIVWDDSAGEVRLFEADDSEWQTFRQEGFERNDMYLAEMKHFLDCLEGRAEPVVDVGEGAEVLRIALAARADAGTGVKPADG